MMVKKMEQDCAVGGEVLFVLSGRPDSNNTLSMGAGECIKKTPLWEAKSFMC